MPDTTSASEYHLLPFRFSALPEVPGHVLLSAETGEYLFLTHPELKQLITHQLPLASPRGEDLEARHFLYRKNHRPPVRRMAAQIRSRKSFLRGGPALHAFVVTLRCDHGCAYCQVTPRRPQATGVDMDLTVAAAAVDRMFESPSPALSVEFQGGEPLLAFDQIRFIVERALELNETKKRSLRFVVATTMHGLDDEKLEFFRTHGVQLSTSLDGPAHLHNTNRPNRDRDSYARTIAAIQYAREALGVDAVAALVTLTRRSLSYPREIIDCYLENGFRSVFLRPLSRYGSAAKAWKHIGYTPDEFLAFYERAFNYLLELNRGGTTIDESYASLLLTSILTPFSHNYVDLRSPTGGGLGALVYHHEGSVYPADEARMLAEMGDDRLRLGDVHTPYGQLLRSPAMQWLLSAGVAESLPGCSECVYLPYCGADPLDALSRQGDPVGHRPTSTFCAKQRGILGVLFRHLHTGDPDVLKIFLAWIAKREPSSLLHSGYRP